MAAVAGATITVNTADDVFPVNGNDGKCTLREAITAANDDTSLGAVSGECLAGNGDDAIIFDSAVFGLSPSTINLMESLPGLWSSVAIQGPGANLLMVQRSDMAANNFRIFSIPGYNTNVTLNGLTISGGRDTGGAGILTSSNGTVNIINSTITGNTSLGGGAAGGIANGSTSGTLNIIGSTITGNSTATNGGGISSQTFAGSVLNIINSTISGNSAQGDCGGLCVNAGVVNITNSTITNNQADSDGNGTGGGAGLYSGGTVTLQNTIVAGNFLGASPNTTENNIHDLGTVTAASSFNLIGPGGTGGMTNGVNDNQVGVADARLGQLANNGGPTQTHALLAGSPALDRGDNALIPADSFDLDGDSNMTEPVPFDQRGTGYTRKADAADMDTVQTVDIGAFEAHPSIEDITDKTTNEDGGLSYSFNYGDRSLGIKTVTFSSSNTALAPNHNILCQPFGSACDDLIVPASNQFGTAIITITITANNDAVISDTFTLTVTAVNDAPSAVNDTLSNIAEDSGTSIIPFSNLVANDSGGPANESAQTLVVNAVSAANGGTVSISGTNVLFTPAPNYSGPASFQYTVRDNGTTNGAADPKTSAAATVSFTVTAVNDAPTANAQSITTNEDAQKSITLTGSDTETASGNLSFAVTSQPTHGTLTGTAPNLTYKPAADYNGTDSFKFTVTDTGDGAAPPLTSAEGTISITVSAVNDAPTTSSENLSSVAEDSGPRTIPFSTLTANDSKGPANESGQSLIVKTVSNPVGGTVQIVGTNVIFTPTANYYGPAAFGYTVEDNGTPPLSSIVPGGVTFSITPVADTPSVTNASTNEDAQTTTGLVITHPDDAAVMNFQITGITGGTLFQNNGTTIISNGDFITAAQGAAGLKFTPAANSNTNGSFQVQSSLNATPAGLGGGFATAMIIINPINDAPTLDPTSNLTINEDAPLQTIHLAGITAGPGETQTLSVTATSSNTGLIPDPTVNYTSPNAAGTLTITPVANQSGSALITVTVKDGGGTANGGVDTVVRTFTLTVNPINDAPINTVPGAQTVQYPNALTFSAGNGNTISVSDADVGAGLLRVELSATGGTLTLSTTSGLVFFTGDGMADSGTTFAGTLSDINAALNGLTYNPATGFGGSATLTLTTSDQGNTGGGGAQTATSTINITVETAVLQLNAPSYTIAEDGGSLSVLVNRSGVINLPVTVNYATSDAANYLQNCNVMNGAATSRCDYVGVLGTLHFAAGENSKTISIPIVNDTYVEGAENFSIFLSNPSGGAVLGAHQTAPIQITDNDNIGQANPIDETSFFVRQHYIDFLGREPDPASIGWNNQINNCVPLQPSCDRLSVSQGIYNSPEFKDRGYFIYKFYSVALGRKPTYDEFVLDRARVSGFQTEAELEQSKLDFISDFMSRPEFAVYSGLSNDQYVQTLFSVAGITQVTVGGVLRTVTEMQQQMAGGRSRAQVLRDIAESPEVSNKFLVESTIVMHYFGYLRRDPDASYQDWINIFNQSGDSRNVTNGFVNSQEYRSRFGQ